MFYHIVAAVTDVSPDHEGKSPKSIAAAGLYRLAAYRADKRGAGHEVLGALGSGAAAISRRISGSFLMLGLCLGSGERDAVLRDAPPPRSGREVGGGHGGAAHGGSHGEWSNLLPR